MNILIAPDSFKGSLSAKDFCFHAEKAIKSFNSNINTIKVPLADGGEGTTQAMVLNTDGDFIQCEVTNPVGLKIEATFGILGDGETAVIEMAEASGLTLIDEEKRNPWLTTTYGTGELIKKALDLNVKKIILGIGGSATNDGGAGMLQALGFKLLNKNGENIKNGAKGINELKYIDISNKDRRLDEVEFLIACDVNNPLYGKNGAAYVYGPQKGADKKMVEDMDEALKNFSKIIINTFDKDVSNIPGAGAAGGLGAGLLAFLNANLKPGFEIISEEIKLEKIFKENKIDLLITGEGEMNYQSINGKLPVEISKLAKKYGVKTVSVVGNMGYEFEKVYQHGVDAVFSITSGPMSLSESIENTGYLVEKVISNIIRLLY
ncbi:glycerate kinase [Oceanotoga sp. DSM 15011]|uniref:glycerate kinase family protein n=1 Tax=Oceanotoga sp. DSM 15011 TaxID=2984951 RepID=UPI0021F47319|nr:glycerate kinase [Oceanotoga sp. DSM 15011]UYO99345.1 glycerate kinase [Oceanotoga sp. DSM 15011]